MRKVEQEIRGEGGGIDFFVKISLINLCKDLR